MSSPAWTHRATADCASIHWLPSSTIAAINFIDEQTTVPPPGPGKGALIDGNIFWNNAQVFENVFASVDVTIKNSLVPALEFDPNVKIGPGNIAADPQFVSPATVGEGLASISGYRLKPGSPCAGKGYQP